MVFLTIQKENCHILLTWTLIEKKIPFSHLEWPTIYNLAKYFCFVRFLIYSINYILKIGIEFGKYTISIIGTV